MTEDEKQKLSLTGTAYRYVFDGIMNGRYRAGQSISPDSLASNLNMSKTPIREALLQLETEGLVVRNGRFYNIIYLDENEVIELYEVRAILEAEASAMAAARMTDDIRKDLKETLRIIKKMSSAENPDPIMLADLNGKLHSMIAAASGNRYIVEYTSNIRLKLKVVRTTLFSSFDRREVELKEHEKVIEAVLSGDQATARRSMWEHEMEVLEYLKASVLNKIY
ncbi:MAG: GntR family transcriptional regulator [Candidatus Thermoplasmatota archaeon]|nr:GntR family transcriptional regulator [Candidatus Thermoplasmatota archaeon]